MIFSKEINIEIEPDTKEPIQVWVPVPKNSRYEYKVRTRIAKLSKVFENLALQEIQSDTFEVREGETNENVFKMVYFSIQPKHGNYKIEVEFETEDLDGSSTLDESYIESALEETQIIDFKNHRITEMVKEIEDFQQMRGIDYPTAVRMYLTRNLKYTSEPATRVASEVASTKLSDCAGYHSLYCALMRSKGIPALIGFGFRTNRDNAYHACAYRFESGKWIREDINDQQMNAGTLLPFLLISVGTNLNIATDRTPGYSSYIQFLQNSLVWIDGIRPKKVERLFNIIN